MIDYLRIIGFKNLQDFKISFKHGINIIIGDNDAGKTTILEALNLVLTGTLFGKSIFTEISPYIFNADLVRYFINTIGTPECIPPKIIIEAVFFDTDETARYRGINNLDRVDLPGVSIVVDLDKEFTEEYKQYIKEKEEVHSVPTEFYGVSWAFFSGNPVGGRSNQIRSTYIDAASIRFASGSDRFINKVINDALTEKDKARLSIEYRKLRETFSKINGVETINSSLAEKGKEITKNDFKVSVDISAKSGWDSVLIPYLDDIPFQFIGMGEQSKLKIGFALNATLEKTSVFLIEEPENHLSFTNMASLIDQISKMCDERQVIISTHNSFVLNKLGLDNLRLLHAKKSISLVELSASTVSYFKRLPGYDTLRMVLAKSIILVEGPTEELIIQRLYLDKYGTLPISNNVDIISVRGLSFKRFLEISKQLKIKTQVITDNDGDIAAVKAKYSDYEGIETIKIIYPENASLSTIEIAFCACNTVANLNKIFIKDFGSIEEIKNWMLNNKTEWSLRVFESAEKIEYPEYIKNAI
ncbi:AAA family ATPase [Treponema zuelzerae]|uniref:AAA family ATPase n=1 Tax=Teretinema zuelzerae TaxID=156 RepID=A0AAE3EJ74_9SPIR|nr:AAA family ATPase [Teretinema zuelzerae]MCD1656000.1 AAA family ATPase [Teretinema zuelzerae]